MARRSLKVEGMSAAYVERTLNETGVAIAEAWKTLSSINSAFPIREYRSIAMHLDKTLAIIAKRRDIVAKSANAEVRREEKKKIDEAVKAALANPEKAQALKELLNL